MKFIIAKKQEMTSVFSADGAMVPVTRVIATPCLVMDKKTKAKDGYRAVLLASEEIAERKVNKPMMGMFEKAFGKKIGYRKLKEFRMYENDATFDKLEIGQELGVNIFSIGDMVKVQGTSKGKGFQGVVKRHHFAGHPATHGHKDQLRMPGSSGATGPAHVFKGRRMAGHMGDELVTLANLEVMAIIPENNEILLKGAVPGARNGVLYLKAKGDFEIAKPEVLEEVAPVEATVVVQAEVAPVEAVEAVETPVAPVEVVTEAVEADKVEEAEETNQTEEKTN